MITFRGSVWFLVLPVLVSSALHSAGIHAVQRLQQLGKDNTDGYSPAAACLHSCGGTHMDRVQWIAERAPCLHEDLNDVFSAPTEGSSK